QPWLRRLSCALHLFPSFHSHFTPRRSIMSDTPDTPTTIPEAHKAALRIGEKLATTTNQHSIFTRNESPTLKFGPDSNNQWMMCDADLDGARSEEHTSELQSRFDLVCRLLLEKKKD